MTTSSDHQTPPKASGEHWYELTATLAQESCELFGDWLSQELQALESDLEQFTTQRSVHSAERAR